jgi:CelD/BcsL family acetyltransferase involved in cellulose biosynthesis
MMATLATTMVDRSRFTVEKIGDGSSFAGLRQEWNELLQSSASDCLFLTWEWLSTWWKHLAADREISIRAVRWGGELVALAPFSVRPPSLPRRCPFSVLEFLGNGNVGSDYLDFIVHNDYEAEALQALAAHLGAERFVFDWRQLKRNGCLAASVASRLSEKGWSVSETSTNTCPFIPLAGKSWESYLATLGAEHRYNFHRKWKRLNRDYAVEFEEVRTAEQCRESIDLVMTLHNMRWSQRGGSEAFHTPGLVAFHREFSQIALERGWLRLYVLRLDGKPAASLYGFLYGRTFYFYQSGLDPAYGKHSVGLVTMGLAIKSALEEGAEEYDLLHGNEDYKSHWSRDSRELGRLELFPPGSLGWIYRSSADLERASRVIARRVLPKSLFDRIRTRLVARQEQL